MHARQQCVLRVSALREQRGDDAGQHVTHSGACHARVAARVDEPCAVGQGANAARAFQHDEAGIARSDFAGRRAAVGLYGRGVAAEQPGCFRGMRRKNGRRGSRAQKILQPGIRCNKVQSVCVEHQRYGAFEGDGERRMCFGRLAQARAHGKTIEGGEPQNLMHCTQHQFRLHGVVTKIVVGEQAGVNPAGSQLQCGASREQCRAQHAARAADDAQAAVIALMAVGAPGRQYRSQHVAADDGAARRLRIETERAQMDLAAMIGTVERKQPGLEADKRCGVVGAHGTAVHEAGVRIKPARHIEREHGDSQSIDRRDDPGMSPTQRASEADPEQAVDREVPLPSGRNPFERSTARIAPG